MEIAFNQVPYFMAQRLKVGHWFALAIRSMPTDEHPFLFGYGKPVHLYSGLKGIGVVLVFHLTLVIQEYDAVQMVRFFGE